MRLSAQHLQSNQLSMMHPLSRCLITLLTITVCNSSATMVLAASKTTTHIHTIYIPASTHQGFASVHIRRTFERLGATVNYTAPPAAVAVERAGRTLLTLLVGSHTVSVNGQPHTSEFAPFNTHGRMIIPLALVKAATHGTTTYNPHTHTARISEVVTVVVSAQAGPNAETDIVLTPDNQKQVFPWWVWLIGVFAVLGLIVLFVASWRRGKNSIFARDNPML